MTTKAETKRQEQAEAIAQLRELYPIGSVVQTILKHRSQSGMTRSIAVLRPQGDSVRDLSYLVAKATGDRLDTTHGGIRIGGAGMDMGYALAYGLARVLYADGFPCAGEKCPSNDHTNEWREPNHTPGRMHSDPGYALGHRWI